MLRAVRPTLATTGGETPDPSKPHGQTAAEILKTYNVWRVQVDRFGGDFPVAASRRFRVTAEVAQRSTSDHHLAMLPVVNAARVVLPDLPELLRELRGLERRTGTGGKDRADHRPFAHDDVASAVSGVVAMLAARGPRDLGITVGRFSA